MRGAVQIAASSNSTRMGSANTDTGIQNRLLEKNETRDKSLGKIPPETASTQESHAACTTAGNLDQLGTSKKGSDPSLLENSAINRKGNTKSPDIDHPFGKLEGIPGETAAVPNLEQLRALFRAETRKIDKKLDRTACQIEEKLIAVEEQVTGVCKALQTETRSISKALTDHIHCSTAQKKQNASTVTLPSKNQRYSIPNLYPQIEEDLQTMFDFETALPALLRSFVEYMENVCRGAESNKNHVKFFYAIMFGKHCGFDKSVFCTEIGRNYGDYRMLMVKNFLILLLRRWSPSNCGTSCNHGTEEIKYKEMSSTTAWVRKLRVRLDVLHAVRNRLETSNKYDVDLAKEHPLEWYVYQYTIGLVNDLLRRARERARCRFFEEIGFILHGTWTICPWVKENPERIVMFSYESAEAVSPSSIPETSEGKDEPARLFNSQMYQKVRDERKELQIEAKYRVWVSHKSSKSGKVPRNADLHAREMCRVISLLDVALKFSAAYTQVSNVDFVLCAHPCALRAVYRMALAFRTLISAELSESHASAPYVHCRHIKNGGANDSCDEIEEEDGKRPMNLITQTENEVVEDRDEDTGKSAELLSEMLRNLDAGVLPLSFLLPGTTVRQRSLESKLIRMSDSRFHQDFAKGPFLHSIESRSGSPRIDNVIAKN